MSLNQDDQKSVEAIRVRAQELASGEQRRGTGHAEILAALADGTLSFEDIPDDALEGCVGEFGADSVVDALIAGAGPAAPVKSWDNVAPNAPPRAAWWRRSAVEILSLWGRPMIPALAAALAVLAAAAGTWLIYERSGSGREPKRDVLTADSRPARPPRVPQDGGGRRTSTTTTPTQGRVTGGLSNTPRKSGPTTASPVSPGMIHAPAGHSATPVSPPISTTGEETQGGKGAGEKPGPDSIAKTTPDGSDSAGHLTTSTPIVRDNVESPPSMANDGKSATNQPTTTASPPTTGGVTTNAVTERPYVAEYPHLGDSQTTTPASRTAMDGTARGGEKGATAIAIQKKLAAEYQLTKTNYDKTEIVTAGSAIVLQKDKVLMLAASSANPCNNTYKDGQIKQSGPCAANEKLKRFSKLTSRIPGSSSVPDSPSSHTFVTGEKFWVTKIEVRDRGKDQGIVFNFFTDEIGDDKTRYATTLLIPFGVITPTPEQALKVVQEVITVAPAEDAKQPPAQSAPQQPAAPAAPAAAAGPPAEAAPAAIEPPPPPPADPAPTPTVSLGQSTDEVVAIMGPPLRIAQIGIKTIYTYKDLKITFVNGKVKDVQ